MRGRWIDRLDEGMLQVLIDEHFHNVERRFGAKDGADETNAMDTVLTPFQIDSGNDTWGAALCIVGSGDTPIDTGMTHFHLGDLFVSDCERTTPYLLRFAWGDNYADAITAGHYSELIVADDTFRYTVRFPRLDVGTKVFACCWVDNNTGNVDFFIGIHESQI